ncbi:MAG TPA: hypothetical protein VFG08_07870 [Candidatus Polarisedimenticolia bacterium]|nr:hypothetical protein [Candidatus Polarisedimenticolia bacterium]
MIRLYDNDSDAEIGSISESQLDALREELIEETLDSNTYNVDDAALDSLERSGMDRQVVSLLRNALHGRSSMELRFEFD